jgi:hypothetical protein
VLIKRQSGGNQCSSRGNQEAISAHQEAISAHQYPSQGSSRRHVLLGLLEFILRSSEVIRVHQSSSEFIRGHQRSSEVIRVHQSSSEVIRVHQSSSEFIRGHQTYCWASWRSPVSLQWLARKRRASCEWSSVVISGHQWSSEVISGHQYLCVGARELLRGN